MTALDEEAPPPPCHPAKSLSFELVQHVGIFFEENLRKGPSRASSRRDILINLSLRYPGAQSTLERP